MKLMFIFLVVLGVTGAVRAATPDIAAEDVLVPKEALRFILGCQRDRSSGAPDGPVPVYHTDIDTDTGTTSQKLSLLDTDQLRESLRGSVHSEEVLELIIGRLNEAVHGAATAAGNTNQLRHEAIHRDSNSTAADDKACTINNNIDISVPAQEVDSFNDRVQMLIQQNSFLLLEQINTLFTYKLRSLREDFENMVRERTKKINRKLDAVLKALGTSEEESPPSISEATTETSSEVETSTDAPGVSEEEQPGKEDEETTEEPSNDSSEVEEDGTRNAVSRPIASPRPVRPFRTRYQPTRTAPSRPSPSRPAPSRTSAVRPERPDRPISERPERPDRPTGERPERPDRLRRLSLMTMRKRKGDKNEANSPNE